jgi:hypothetical protein
MWINLLLKTVLFMLLVPGVILSIPPGASLLQKALVHGLVFAVVNNYVYHYVRPMLERFDNPDTKVLPPCPAGSVRRGNDCRMKGEGESPQSLG